MRRAKLSKRALKPDDDEHYGFLAECAGEHCDACADETQRRYGTYADRLAVAGTLALPEVLQAILSSDNISAAPRGEKERQGTCTAVPGRLVEEGEGTECGQGEGELA